MADIPGSPGAARPTEDRNAASLDIDLMPTRDVVGVIVAEDAVAAAAVAARQGEIAAAVDLAVAAVRAGGRIHYVGAGTSGRLAVLDAAELGPTFGVGEEWVVAHLAGGHAALVVSSEETEDDADQGRADAGVLGPHDFVLGLTASGRTPYVRGALESAREVGAATALVTSNAAARLGALADVVIALETGPEIIAGSTRMKAGTAQKMVLTAFSTATMVALGRVFSNLMIDVRASNTKLRARQVRILAEAAGQAPEHAARALEQCGGDARTALVVLAAGVTPRVARAALERSDGSLRRALAQAAEVARTRGH